MRNKLIVDGWVSAPNFGKSLFNVNDKSIGVEGFPQSISDNLAVYPKDAAHQSQNIIMAKRLANRADFFLFAGIFGTAVGCAPFGVHFKTFLSGFRSDLFKAPVV